MVRRLPIDLDLARAGYLQLPNQYPRAIPGIERLAADTSLVGAEVWWADLPPFRPGLSDPEMKQILLADWLCCLKPTTIKRVWSEELGHCVVGHSEERAQAWQWKVYRDILLPAWAV